MTIWSKQEIWFVYQGACYIISCLAIEDNHNQIAWLGKDYMRIYDWPGGNTGSFGFPGNLSWPHLWCHSSKDVAKLAMYTLNRGSGMVWQINLV